MPNRQTRSLDDFSASDIDRITTGLIRERVESMAPLRIIIMGTAGTGKSYLINAIQSTIHSSLSVPICGANIENL
uniref:ATP-dependent DNA helicase n=1 Tax=Rhizophagus irregularis (strain DAOM 181602 / DAOM 197198 / MUCL 43194) TaxID=747089 RepID=U9T7J4_RHIID